MNTEYVWWAVVLALVVGGSIAFLALGPVPEIGSEPEAAWDDGANEAPTNAGAGRDAAEGANGAGGTIPAAATDAAGGTGDQGLPLSTTEPGPSAPTSNSDTP